MRARLAEDGSFFVNIKPHCEDGERVLYVMDLVLAMKRQWGWRFVDELCWISPGVPGAWPNRFKNAWESIWHFCTIMPKFRPKQVAHYSNELPFSRGGMPGRGSGKSYIEEIDDRISGLAYPSNVIKAQHDTTKKETERHAAAFSIALPDFFIRAYSDIGDIWLDPFVGSGTTIAAAHQNDRRGLGIEILERYISVTLQRLADMDLEPKLLQ